MELTPKKEAAGRDEETRQTLPDPTEPLFVSLWPITDTIDDFTQSVCFWLQKKMQSRIIHTFSEIRQENICRKGELKQRNPLWLKKQ